MATRLAPLLLGVFLCVVGLATFANSAQAAELDKKGVAHAKEATRLYKQGQYEEAAKIFAQLSIEHPDMPVFERNLGACFYYLKKPEPALSNLRNYLNHKKGIARDDKAVVDRWIQEMESLRAQRASEEQPQPPAPQSPGIPETSSPEARATQPEAKAPEPSRSEIAPPLAEQPISRENKGRNLRIAGIACGALGLASFGTAIYYYTRATSLSDRVSHDAPASRGDYQDGKRAERMQWVFYGIGTGAVAAGVVLYLLGWSASSRTPVAGVTPLMGPGMAGLSAQGAF